jgi:hypothetical protein
MVARGVLRARELVQRPTLRHVADRALVFDHAVLRVESGARRDQAVPQRAVSDAQTDRKVLDEPRPRDLGLEAAAVFRILVQGRDVQIHQLAALVTEEPHERIVGVHNAPSRCAHVDGIPRSLEENPVAILRLTQRALGITPIREVTIEAQREIAQEPDDASHDEHESRALRTSLPHDDQPPGLADRPQQGDVQADREHAGEQAAPRAEEPRQNDDGEDGERRHADAAHLVEWNEGAGVDGHREHTESPSPPRRLDDEAGAEGVPPFGSHACSPPGSISARVRASSALPVDLHPLSGSDAGLSRCLACSAISKTRRKVVRY